VTAPPVEREQIPTIVLESMDGSVRIPLDNTMGWIRMPGATGLKMPPYRLIANPIPGVAGSNLEDVRVEERPVFIPIYCRSATSQQSHLEMLDQLYSLIDPTVNSFKIVGETSRGARELIVTYDGGLEGADGGDSEGLSWCKVGLKAVAHEPFARAREDRRLEFRVISNTVPFLGAVGGTDSPFPAMLSTTSVIGNGMEIEIESEVPVYPTLELIGTMSSFTGTLSPIVTLPGGAEMVIEGQVWSVEVPLGVAAGSSLKLVTDPRARSIRLDGALAAGRVARGSSLRPFYPGLNVLDVAAPGGNDDTRIILSWRDLYRSLW